MDTITINRSKQSTVEFNLRVDGASIEEANAKFVIRCDGYSVSVDCSRVSQEVFNANVPPLPFINKGVHDCSIEVVINGQVFVPLKGNVTVVDNVSVSASTQPTAVPAVNGEEQEEQTEGEENEEVPSVKPSTPLSALNITKYLQTRNAAEEEEFTEGEKDKKIRQILESLNIDVKKTPGKKRSSLKDLTASKRASKKLAE